MRTWVNGYINYIIFFNSSLTLKLFKNKWLKTVKRTRMFEGGKWIFPRIFIHGFPLINYA